MDQCEVRAGYDEGGDFSRPLLKGLRSSNLFTKRGGAVLDAPGKSRVLPEGGRVGGRGATVTEMPLRRGPSFVEDFSDAGPAKSTKIQGRPATGRPGVRVSFTGGLVPESLWGRVAAVCGLLALAGCGVAGILAVRSFALHDPHFLVENSSAVEIAGNSHLSRAQLLSVFGGDVERNIFKIPLEGRRTELEGLPWVQHATVMRLLPDRVRIVIVERTPVAFVREGRRIGLVDANGVLLDFGAGDAASQLEGGGASEGDAGKYSFPVVTGINEADPESTRAARMRIYAEFLRALDSGGEGISHKLSEVDLSDPEDVRALVSDAAAGTEVLVHFGQDRYLDRYHRFEEHVAEWRQQYPHLASVDMRYEQQVVLDMLPGASADTRDAGNSSQKAVEPKLPPTAQRKSSNQTALSLEHAHKAALRGQTSPSAPLSRPVAVHHSTPAFPVNSSGARGVTQAPAGVGASSR